MENNSELLTGKVCLVTGASRGIGRSIAEHFLAEGAIVYANARKNGSLEQIADQVTQVTSDNVKPSLRPLYYDVTDTASVQSAITQIYKTEHRLDVLVNNAGITKNELIGMIHEETVESLFRTNVFACIQHIQYATRLMKKQKSGSIINISSIIGVEGGVGELVYSGTKGAVISMTKSASKELAPDHIRVNSVAPGMTGTDMFFTAAQTEENVKRHIKNIGFGRLAKPDDIAEACVFLASDRAEFITGQILGVNGGTII